MGHSLASSRNESYTESATTGGVRGSPWNKLRWKNDTEWGKNENKTSCMSHSKKTHSLSSQNLLFFSPNSLKQFLKKRESHLNFKLAIFKLFLTRPKEDEDNKKEDSAWNQSQQSSPSLTSDTGEQSWLTAVMSCGNSLEYKWERESGVGG